MAPYRPSLGKHIVLVLMSIPGGLATYRPYRRSPFCLGRAFAARYTRGFEAGAAELCGHSGPRHDDSDDERRYLPPTDFCRGLSSALARGSLGGPPSPRIFASPRPLFSVSGALYYLWLLESSALNYDLARPSTWIIALPWHLVGMLAAGAVRTHLATSVGIFRLVGNGGSILSTSRVPNGLDSPSLQLWV